MESIKPYIKFLPYAGVVVLVVLMVYFQKTSSASDASKLQVTQNSESPQQQAVQIYLDISGAVNKPGFYTMSVGDRVVDLVKAAGGLSAQANVDFVTQSLNLSQKLADGQKFFIPFVFSQDFPQNSLKQNISCLPSLAATSSASVAAGNTSSEGSTDNTQKVNVNTATKDELLGLYGIGESYAAKIIQNRPYTSTSDFNTKVKLTSKTAQALEGVLIVE